MHARVGLEELLVELERRELEFLAEELVRDGRLVETRAAARRGAALGARIHAARARRHGCRADARAAAASVAGARDSARARARRSGALRALRDARALSKIVC
jgi:hypothetical protein